MTKRLMAVMTPKTSWGWVKALLRSIFEQTDEWVENPRYRKVPAGPESPSWTPTRAPRRYRT